LKMFVSTQRHNKPSASEILRPGKKAMAPPPPHGLRKKPSKNLNINSENPLLSTGATNTNTTAADHRWINDLAAAVEEPERESWQPSQDPDFEIPPCLEAFAEKIGLGLDSQLTGVWADLEEADTTPEEVRSPSPSLLFHDYAMPPKEELWESVVCPLEVEGRQLAEDERTVTALSEEDTIVQFSEADLDELDAFLKNGLPTDTEGMEVEDSDPLTAPGQNFDIVKFAMGESGVRSHEDVPDTCNNTIPLLQNIKSEPEFEMMEPVDNVNIEIIEEKPRKKAGRPVNKNPITVTEIPRGAIGKLSGEEIKALKYRRMRELNNKASRRFRQKKKEEERNHQEILKEFQKRNMELKLKLAQMEEDVAMWRAKVSSINNRM